MPGLEGSSYPPGQYVAPPRGPDGPAQPSASVPAIAPAAGAVNLGSRVVAAATPGGGSPTFRTLVQATVFWQGTKQGAARFRVQPGNISAGLAVVPATGATQTTELITFIVPPGGTWDWVNEGGTIETVEAREYAI